MKEHECIIGLLHYTEDSELCTLSQLRAHMEERADFNKTLANDKTFCNCKSLYFREYTLAEYCDKRVSTNLRQFDYCPICGKKIDWKTIKGRED